MSSAPDAAGSPEPRILMVVPQYPFPVMGGLERQAHELAKALHEIDVRIQVISGRTRADQPDRESVDGVVVHRIAWPASKIARAFLTPAEIWRVLRSQRGTYDVVHLHQVSSFSLLTLLLAHRLRKPVLIKLPGVGPFGLPGLRRSFLGGLKLRLFRRADAVVAMSAESLRELRACGYPMSAVLRTPNGIRTAEAVPIETATSTGCRFVFVGRLDPGKGLEDLLEVWPGVILAAPGASLEIWGHGPLLEGLQARARRLSVAGSVLFRGHVDSVMEQLHGMDVFVLPSLAEGNSNAILEAMAAGLPIVSTAVGGTPMLVGREGAYLIRPGDRAALRSHLVALASDPGARLDAGRRMRARIERHFDIRRVAGTYREAYRRLAAGKRHTMAVIGDPLIGDA